MKYWINGRPTMAAIIDPRVAVTIFTKLRRSNTGERYFEGINHSKNDFGQYYYDGRFCILKIISSL